MTGADVLAVIVSYNGGDKTRRSVEALRAQVGGILIVDNGSDAESLAVLETLEREAGVAVVRLGANRGIGHALNIGMAHAREGGFSWLLTMDQDSVADATMIAAFCAAVAGDARRVCLSPVRSDVATHGEEVVTEIRYAITSGNLVRLDVFDETGPYDEDLFIDGVDFDFSLRVRRAGHSIHRVSAAGMRHQVGEEVRAPGMVRRYYTQHSPHRRYYMYRNHMYLMERYLGEFPGFIGKLTVSQAILTVLVGFLDPSPMASYRAMARGFRDYVARKSGPYQDQAR